jgi:hypothetical protein
VPVAVDGGGGGLGSDVGIPYPDGDPAALEHAAADLRGAAGVLDRTSAGLQGGATPLDWKGAAAMSYANMCVDQGSAAGSGSGCLSIAAKVLADLGHELRAAQRACRAAIEDARAAKAAAAQARQAAQDAADKARALAQDAAAAAHRAAQAEATGTPGAGSADRALQHQLTLKATDADTARTGHERAAGRADGTLADAQSRGIKAYERYERAARAAAGQLSGLASMAPTVTSVNGVPVAAIGGAGRPPTIAPIMPKAPQKKEEDHGGGIGGWIHGALDAGGFIPVVGAAFDAANGVYYAAEGDGVNAALSFGAAVPVVGDAAAAGKLVYKGAKAAEGLEKGAEAAKAIEGGTDLAAGAGKVMPSGTAADGSFIPEVLEGDVLPLAAKPHDGQKLYRAYGQPADADGLKAIDKDGFSWPEGRSWTPSDPSKMANPRSELGLPDVNGGRFVIEGELKNADGVIVRHALPLDGQPGGGIEYLVPDPAGQIRIIRVGGVNPPY